MCHFSPWNELECRSLRKLNHRKVLHLIFCWFLFYKAKFFRGLRLRLFKVHVVLVFIGQLFCHLLQLSSDFFVYREGHIDVGETCDDTWLKVWVVISIILVFLTCFN